MVDARTGHETMSFMDGSSRYNQIRMSPKDEECTTFRTPKGIYCYKVMPFGLKNAGATYQHAMQNIFDDMLHKRVECFIDDLVITYTPQKLVKGQALANFLVDHPLQAEWELPYVFPDEDILFIEELPSWKMFFDGYARHNGAGAGVLLISPERQVLPFSFVLGETCSNNAA
uniref:Reverse transcriptase domain-containing protein n=1 Tax=Nicotiana tabacum TaxID=4097 RepID=A0A1S3XAP2_TOBAC|nr:PREDICTED: uncharacterized protein LOC107763069 [Nicotiana tabacum]